MKYIFWTVIALIAAVLLAAAFFLGRRNAAPSPPPALPLKTVHSVGVQSLSLTQRQVPALIDTVRGPGAPHERANYHASIDSNKVKLDLDVQYDEQTNLFDLVRAKVTTLRDSVYTERVIQPPTPFLRLTGGLAIHYDKTQATDKYRLASVGADLGVRIADRYSLTAGIDTRGSLSARFGIDF